MIGEGVSTAQRSDSLVQLINQHFLNHIVELINMSFSEFDVTRRTRKGNFLNQIDYLIDWTPIEKAIAEHYAPT